MRITQSYGYHHGWTCEKLNDCEHHYCNVHRLLWSDCETVKMGIQGDRDVIGGVADYAESGDCPDCENDRTTKTMEVNHVTL